MPASRPGSARIPLSGPREPAQRPSCAVCRNSFPEASRPIWAALSNDQPHWSHFTYPALNTRGTVELPTPKPRAILLMPLTWLRVARGLIASLTGLRRPPVAPVTGGAWVNSYVRVWEIRLCGQ